MDTQTPHMIKHGQVQPIAKKQAKAPAPAAVQHVAATPQAVPEKSAPAPVTGGPTASIQLRSFRVSLGHYGPTSPDPKNPNDAPILALDEEEAWKVFCKRHGIVGSEKPPDISEL